MLSSRIIVVPPKVRYIRRMTTRAQKNDDVWDPDEQRRINENKTWRADQPEEDVWDIDKERDAIMYKRESLESAFRIGQKKQIEKWESYTDKEEDVNSSKDD